MTLAVEPDVDPLVPHPLAIQAIAEVPDLGGTSLVWMVPII